MRSCNLPINSGNASSVRSDNTEIPISHSANALGHGGPPHSAATSGLRRTSEKQKEHSLPEVVGCSIVLWTHYHPGVSLNVVFHLYVLLCSAESCLIAEIGKRILRLPKCIASNVVRLVPSTRACVLCIKLAFLLKTMNSTSSLSSHVFCSLAVDDVEALQLVDNAAS